VLTQHVERSGYGDRDRSFGLTRSLQLGNERCASVNAVVGETTERRVERIRGLHVTGEHVLRCIARASRGRWQKAPSRSTEARAALWILGKGEACLAPCRPSGSMTVTPNPTIQEGTSYRITACDGADITLPMEIFLNANTDNIAAAKPAA